MSFRQFAIFLGVLCALLWPNAYAAENDLSATVGWGYFDHIAPAFWHSLHDEFKICQSGTRQSPIAIPANIETSHKKLQFDYHRAELVIADDDVTRLTIKDQLYALSMGHGIQVDFPKGNQFITYQQKRYRLLQYHLHTPAQHQIQNVTFPLEIEFVHQSEDGAVLLLSVLAKFGKPHAEIANIVSYLPKYEGKPTPVAGIYMDPTRLLPQDRSFYVYHGSLTVPPCLEGVNWVVLANPIEVSKEQVERIMQAGDFNARPIQPLHGRKVSLN